MNNICSKKVLYYDVNKAGEFESRDAAMSNGSTVPVPQE